MSTLTLPSDMPSGYNVPAGLTLMNYSPLPGLSGEITGTNTNSFSTPSNGVVQSVNTTVDPYARWGGQSGYAAQKSSFDASANSVAGGARTGFGDVVNEYDTKNKTFVTDQKEGQDAINRGKATNQLNFRRSMQNIVKGVQNGVRSGGVALANMNASDSGAADALARAYAKVGNEQSSEVAGETAMQFEELQRQQGQLQKNREDTGTEFETWKATETSRIRQDFSDKMALLQAQAQEKGMSVDTSMVDQITNDAIARLSQIDQQRQQGIAGVQSWTPEQIMAEAIRLDQLGQGSNPFKVAAPEVSYGSNRMGAPMSQMPIYMRGREDVIAPARKELQTA